MESIIGSVKSMDKITFHCPFSSFLPLFCILPPPPPPKKKGISHLHTFQLYFFHCRDNMVKINTFSMAVSKTYCLFNFQTEICLFFIFFIRSIFGPRKNAIYLRIFLWTFPMELKYLENIKEIINGIYYRFS